MIPLRRSILILFFAAATVASASPSDAQNLQKKWQLSMDQWSVQLQQASTPEARAKIWSAHPDATATARQMWAILRTSLHDDWTLEPAAWFLQLTRGVMTHEGANPTPAFAQEAVEIRKAIETHHLKSEKLIPICMAMATGGDPRALPTLEKIQNSHPSPKIQGVAALGVAMLLKSLDDNPELMRKRLTGLRKAIELSCDVNVGGHTVADLARDELYVINHLTKGRQAPDLAAKDAAGRSLKISDYPGKVIVLIFWNSSHQDADKLIRITNDMAKKFRDRPLKVLGVNSDPLEKLRQLEGAGVVSWQNFSDPDNTLARHYRVGTWPLVYVLDGERKIHYAGAPGSFVNLTAEALLSELNPADATPPP